MRTRPCQSQSERRKITPAYLGQPQSRPERRGQFWAIVENSELYAKILVTAGGIVAGILVLFLVSGPARSAARNVARQWPIWILGITGLAMYVVVHVEERYVGVFFALVWLGLLAGMRVHRHLDRRIVPAVALGIALSILGPMALDAGDGLLVGLRANYPDPDVEAAMQLKRLGVEAGSPVARISNMLTDLGWARLSRVSIVAEVDFEHADEFWTAGQKAQDEVLQAFAKAGARIVVAHTRGNTAPLGWERLGRTRYFIHRLG